ncbi:MAG: response regulator [Cyclobacteriaceae bacterium]
MTKLGRIFLVDDDEITNFIHQAMIRDMDIAEKVLVAHNGQEALNLLNQKEGKQHEPTLVLLDINMPVMNGYEFLEAFHALEEGKKENTVIVALTSSQNPSDIDNAKNLGATDYLNKPLKPEKIRQLLAVHFEQK